MGREKEMTADSAWLTRNDLVGRNVAADLGFVRQLPLSVHRSRRMTANRLRRPPAASRRGQRSTALGLTRSDRTDYNRGTFTPGNAVAAWRHDNRSTATWIDRIHFPCLHGRVLHSTGR